MKRLSTDFTAPTSSIKEVTVDRLVTKAYLTDDKGQPTTNPSKVITLELAVNPDKGSPSLYSMSIGYNPLLPNNHIKWRR